MRHCVATPRPWLNQCTSQFLDGVIWLKPHGKARCSMLDRPIISLAVWLSKPVGFLATCFTVVAGLGSGALLSFNDHWALVFNLFLSIAAMLLAGVILVAGARDTAAIQIKLDELIRAVADTDERLIGIEDRSAEELELLRNDKLSPPSGSPEQL